MHRLAAVPGTETKVPGAAKYNPTDGGVLWPDAIAFLVFVAWLYALPAADP